MVVLQVPKNGRDGKCLFTSKIAATQFLSFFLDDGIHFLCGRIADFDFSDVLLGGTKKSITFRGANGVNFFYFNPF